MGNTITFIKSSNIVSIRINLYAIGLGKICITEFIGRTKTTVCLGVGKALTMYGYTQEYIGIQYFGIPKEYKLYPNGGDTPIPAATSLKNENIYKYAFNSTYEIRHI